MGESNLALAQSSTFAILTVVLVLSVASAIATSVFRDITPSNSFIYFAVHNHVWFFIIAIFLSVGYGFYWSSYVKNQVAQKVKNIDSLLELVHQFLSSEERLVFEYLLEHDGKSSQADIARLENMSRVKAMRTVQKMQEKRLIEISAHGKMRYIILKEDIKNLF